MKNTKIIALLMSVVILASCSTSNDVVDGGIFQKRKYNKGYHISKKSKVSTTTADSEEVAMISDKNDIKTNLDSPKSTVKSEEKPASAAIKEKTEITNEIENSVAMTEVKKETTKKSVIDNVSAKVDLDSKRNMDRTQSKSSAFSFSKLSDVSSSTEVSAETLLLVIIALFIPFLAVGLYEGLSTRFWISLILTLLFVLPGVIYAILVVTGTI